MHPNIFFCGCPCEEYCAGADHAWKIDDDTKVVYYMSKKSYYIDWGKTSWTDTAAYS